MALSIAKNCFKVLVRNYSSVTKIFCNKIVKFKSAYFAPLTFCFFKKAIIVQKNNKDKIYSYKIYFKKQMHVEKCLSFKSCCKSMKLKRRSYSKSSFNCSIESRSFKFLHVINKTLENNLAIHNAMFQSLFSGVKIFENCLW